MIRIPAATTEPVAWRQSVRRGGKDDRMVREIETCVPGLLAETSVAVDDAIHALSREALSAMRAFERESIRSGISLNRLMLKTESVASSRIELINAAPIEISRAVAGQKGLRDGEQIIAGTKAIESLMAATGEGLPLVRESMLTAHAILMRDDTAESEFAGAIRSQQNWIGGNQFSPVNADFVPPKPERLDALLVDLFRFANRIDLDPLVQTAITHAQFETIHPFTDGNGRLGRGIISALLARHGLITESVVPIACAIVGVRERYIDALTAFRDGDAEPIVRVVLAAIITAAREGIFAIGSLTKLAADWEIAVTSRSDSSARAVAPMFLGAHALSTTDIVAATGISTPAATSAVTQLESAGIVIEVTGRKRDRFWTAPAIWEISEDYAARVAATMKRQFVN